MNEKEQILIKDKISYAEEFDINLFWNWFRFLPKRNKRNIFKMFMDIIIKINLEFNNIYFR